MKPARVLWPWILAISMGWTGTLWIAFHWWQAQALEFQRTTLEAIAQTRLQRVQASSEGSTAASTAPEPIQGGVYEEFATDRLLPEDTTGGMRFHPSLRRPCMVVEHSLGHGKRVHRLSQPLSGSGLPDRAWILLAVATIAGLVLPWGFWALLSVRDRQRVSQLEDLSRTLHRTSVGPGALLDRETRLVIQLSSELRRGRVLSGWTTRRLGRLLDSFHEGVLLLDSRQKILAINTVAAHCLQLRVPKGGARGRPVASVLGDVEFLDDLRRGLERGTPGLFLVERTDSIHEVRLLPVGLDGGMGSLVTLQDVTDRHRAEQLKARFVSDASHEFKTPLTSIRGWTETLLEDEADDFRRKALERIRQGTRHLEEVVRDLLDLGRIAELPARGQGPVDLVEIAREAVETLTPQADGKRIQLQLVVQGVALLRGHRTQLLRAMINLLSNAVRHAPPSGWVRLSILDATPNWIVEVADSGPGIPPEAMPHLFDRFYRSDPGRARSVGGTGLGLAIVKETATAHRGEAKVESPAGSGAIFRLVLPREPDFRSSPSRLWYA